MGQRRQLQGQQLVHIVHPGPLMAFLRCLLAPGQSLDLVECLLLERSSPLRQTPPLLG